MAIGRVPRGIREPPTPRRLEPQAPSPARWESQASRLLSQPQARRRRRRRSGNVGSAGAVGTVQAQRPSPPHGRDGDSHRRASGVTCDARVGGGARARSALLRSRSRQALPRARAPPPHAPRRAYAFALPRARRPRPTARRRFVVSRTTEASCWSCALRQSCIARSSSSDHASICARNAASAAHVVAKSRRPALATSRSRASPTTSVPTDEEVRRATQ